MNNEINTGGPAFPIHWENHNEGMTLRDYFAAKAMQGMLGGTWPDKADSEETARRAYQLADAMIKARNA